MGFLAPSLLLLLSLATIPVIIHLIQRIRLRKISYSSLFFITQTNRETFSWLQVKEILLLIFRTLFVFFLLFSLARPYFVKKIYTSKSEASRLIILDDSYSMAYQNNFTRAKQTALKLIQELKKGSEAAFLTSSGSVKVNFTTDFFSLEKMIDTLRVSFSGRSLEPCFNKGLDIMSDAVQAQKDIYIITDLQKRALEPILERVNFISQESEYDITVVDVGKENHINVGIEEVFVSPNFPGPDFPSRPYVKVKNYSNQTSRRMLFFSLKFSEKESIIYSSQKEIVLNPYEVKAVIIETEISQPGKYLFEASLSRDSLPADDRYFYTVKIDEKKQVLLIRDNAQESQYLARALQTGDFVIAQADARALYQQNLRQYAVIGLINPTRLSVLDFERIGHYVSGGGGVFAVLSEEIQTSGWTDILNLKFSAQGKPVVISPPGFVSIQEVNYDNPIMVIFKDINLSAARFYAYWALDNFSSSSVLAYFSSGKPFLMQPDNQKIIIAFTAFDVSKTDFVFKATFLPLMHRIFTYLSSPVMQTDYLINDTIRVQPASALALRIRTPHTEFLQTPNIENGQFILKFSDTYEPGLYYIGDNVFSVNVHPAEGDLSRITQGALKQHNIKVVTEVGSKTTDFTRISILLAILFLVLELVLLIV